jgi:hypothetical protein
MNPELCAECGEPTQFPNQVIDLTGGERHVYHLDCWLDRQFVEAHIEQISEEDCF